MAGVLMDITSGEVTCSTSAKTVLQVKAPANQEVLIKEIAIYGKSAAGGTDQPSKVRGTRCTANFGTGTTATPAKSDPADSETIQTTAFSNFTVEPTSPSDAGFIREVNPQVGLEVILSPDQYIKVPGGQAYNFEVTAPAGTPTFVIDLVVEE